MSEFYIDNDQAIWDNDSESLELGEKIPKEFYDMQKVIDMGALKHGKGSWANKDNASLQHKSNTASLFRHLAEHHAGIQKDEESGLDPLLHLATRALMRYTRKKRGIDAE